MNHNKETFATWNKIASLYEDKFMNLEVYNESYDILCSGIPKQQASILEVGCGPGNISRYLLNKRADFRLFGTDIAPNMIDLARKNNPEARFEVMDTRSIGELKEKFDGVVAGFCIPYLSADEVKIFLRDSYELMNDNGLIYLSFVAGSPELSGFKVGSSGDRVYFYYHEMNWLREQLSNHHFKELKVLTVQYVRNEKESEVHSIVIAQK